LKRRAAEILENGIRDVDSLDDALDILENWDGILRTRWCGEMDCAEQIEKTLDRSFLGFPLADIESGELQKENGNCMNCGRPTETVVFISRSY
jgi:hypothetical protein